MVGLLHRWKHRVVACFSSETPTPGSASGEGDQTVSGGASVANPPMTTYAVITQHRKERGEDAPVYYALSLAEPGESSSSTRPIPSARTDPLLTDQDCFYSTIQSLKEETPDGRREEGLCLKLCYALCARVEVTNHTQCCYSN
ncbi:uncharacterized protein LOC144543523 [Centroberyx gerrardi]